jgi:hypothetical protein
MEQVSDLCVGGSPPASYEDDKYFILRDLPVESVNNL